MPVDDATKILGPRLSPVKTSAGQIHVPSIQPMKFTALPFERKDLILAISIEKTVTLPTELLCQVYLPAETNMVDMLASFAALYGYSPNGKSNSTCTGRITMPLVMFTGKGVKGTEYAMSVDDLEGVIAAQQDYIKNNISNNFARKSVLHAQTVVNKYKKLISP